MIKMAIDLRGAPAIIAKMWGIEKLAGAAFERGCKKAAEWVKKESQKIVPVDTGALRDSAEVINSGGTGFKSEYGVSYGRGLEPFDYSLIQHEVLTYAHTPPGQAKYLEEVIMTRKSEIVAIIIKEMAKVG